MVNISATFSVVGMANTLTSFDLLSDAIVEDVEIRVCILECHLTLVFAREK